MFPGSYPQIAQTRRIQTELQNEMINSIIKICTGLRSSVKDVIYFVRIGSTKKSSSEFMYKE